MRAIDLKNAVNRAEHDNFTKVLFGLILKSDKTNLRKLAKGYPVEVEMVEIFHGDCIYFKETVDGRGAVDFEAIEKEAVRRVDARSGDSEEYQK